MKLKDILKEIIEVNTNIKEIEKAIGEPIDNWKGNCYGVAQACVDNKIVKGKVRYGHYRGYISPKSLFAGHIGIKWCHHAWVEMEDGTIFDPTRWVFEVKEPYIFVGKNNGEYSVGERVNKTPPPVFDSNKKVFDVSNWNLELLNFIKMLLKDKRTEKTLSLMQIFWIANEDPKVLENFAKPLYIELEKMGEDAFIPQSNWELVME
jgi:hypothetical protein